MFNQKVVDNIILILAVFDNNCIVLFERLKTFKINFYNYKIELAI